MLEREWEEGREMNEIRLSTSSFPVSSELVGRGELSEAYLSRRDWRGKLPENN